MTRTRTGNRLLALTSAALLGLVPALAAPKAYAVDGPNLKIAITADFESFNPFTTVYAAPININRLQFESLVEVGKDNESAPGMAEKWQTSPDGKVWTYTIPSGRTWSDGKPLTAEDPAFTLTSIKTDEKLASANGSLVENLESAVARDPNTLVVTMKEAQAANPGLEIPIVPKHVWEAVPDKATHMAEITEPVVGSGPFTITKYAKGQSVELTANDRFWRGPAKLSGITYVYYRNTDAAVQGLRAGEVDLVSGLTAAQFGALRNEPNVKVSNGAGRRYQALAINPGTVSLDGQPMGDGNEVLKDPAVRRAIFSAVDNKALIERVLGGLAKPGVTQVPPVYPSYYGLPAGAQERRFDLEAANRTLDEAGYRKNDAGVRLDKQGNPIKLRLLGRSTAAEHAQMADFVKQWMQQIGIEIDVIMASNSQVGNDSTLGKYDLYFTGWGIGPDPDFQLSINQCSSRPNTDGSGATSENNWCDPAFDALYAAQHTELDPAKRADLVKQAYKLIYDANVLNVMYYADALEAWRGDRFVDFPRQPSNGGVIYGQSSYWSLWGAEPVGAQQGAPAAESTNIGLIVGGGVLALVAAGVVFWVLRRRSGSAEHKE